MANEGGHVIRGSKNMNQRIETKYINLNAKLLKVEGNSLYFDNKKVGVLFTSAPPTSTSSGTAGDIAYDEQYFYLCVATNKWVRNALASW